MRNISIPLRSASVMSDYACHDGEIAVADNLIPVLPVSDSSSDIGSGSGSDSGDSSSAPSSPSPFRLTLPPVPEVEFSLSRTVLPGWHSHPDMLPSAEMVKGDPTESGWGKIAMKMLGRFEDRVREENLFMEPFFVICAVRMKDGQHILPTPPVLMIPNSGSLPVSGSSDFSAGEMKMSVVAAVCALQWRVRISDELRKSDGMTHLDIFVSDRISLYSRSADAIGEHRFSCSNFSHSLATDGSSGEHPVYAGTIVQGWIPEPTDGALIHMALREATSFHLVSEVAISSLPRDHEFSDVCFNCGGLEMSDSFPAYTPDYAHLSDVAAAGSSLMSLRTTIWDLTLVAPLPRPLSQSVPCSSAPLRGAPRWIFHPDPCAGTFPYESGDAAYGVTLRRHPSLYGGYWWGGLAADPPEATPHIPATPSLASRTVRLPQAIWRSARRNPLCFPDRLLLSPDVERVVAVCRAFRASGLVATAAPTAYLFTSDGVYLLREMDDGTFRDAGLICTYVLRDPSAYSLRGKSVVFPTDSGDIVEIQGTVVKVNSGISAVSPTSAAVAGKGIAYTASVAGEESRLVTRPLKLGDAEKWKRVIELHLRGDYDFSTCRLSLYGSPDLREWREIAGRQGGIISGLWSPLCRYFRVEATLRLREGDTLEALYLITN